MAIQHLSGKIAIKQNVISFQYSKNYLDGNCNYLCQANDHDQAPVLQPLSVQRRNQTNTTSLQKLDCKSQNISTQINLSCKRTVFGN